MGYFYFKRKLIHFILFSSSSFTLCKCNCIELKCWKSVHNPSSYTEMVKNRGQYDDLAKNKIDLYTLPWKEYLKHYSDIVSDNIKGKF